MMNFDTTLDAKGLNCPMPILRTKKALSELNAGQVLRVFTNDPGAMKDFPTYCKKQDHELLDSVSDNGGDCTFFIKK